jgi:predicted AlkP superfamily pyrophosphatase or phosphodiesterase
VHGTPDGFAADAERALGSFPFSAFWGPRAGLPCSQWIARAAARTLREQRPTLTLVYLPHLDYDLQRFGPDAALVPQRLREVDACLGEVVQAARAVGALTVVVSEYGLMPVRRGVELNRILRRAGWLTVRDGPFGEMLDTFNSRAFAVCDHQVAHVYVADRELVPRVVEQLQSEAGIDRVLAGEQRAQVGLDHARSGEIVAFATRDSWFAYPYWMDDARAPDFARTVDIHRKPGYDPMELFLDPAGRGVKARAALRLLQKAAGMRYKMDVVGLDPAPIRGSHGVEPADPMDGPLLILPDRRAGTPASSPALPMTAVRDLVLARLGLDSE